MPLSEYERRVLAQMEQHLRDADPGLEKSFATKGRLDVKKLSIGIVIALGGLAVLIAGVAVSQVWLGIAGFVIMLAGVMMATSITPPRKGAAPRRSSSGFMARQQERWERRQDGR